MISFNEPPYLGTEMDYMRVAAENRFICGDGPFTKKCHAWLEGRFPCAKALLTTSGTSALELAAILCNIQPGDEVILPSYTFSSTATAFVMQGAQLVFVDVRPDTMNIDETKIEAAITEKTKVIVVVDYAGVAPEMDTINDIARRYHLFVVEDAAQAIMSTYKGRPCGTLADFGCFSFHETKNYSMGEGGALLVQDSALAERAEIVREKGTDRARFYRGQVDKYTWMDKGSSYLPSELNAAYLLAQLECADAINEDRLNTWQRYYEGLRDLGEQGLVQLPVVPDVCVHNAHMFYIKCANLAQRTELIAHLRDHDVQACFHYIPLHSAPAGLRFGRFNGEDVHTTAESEKLVRLPMYYGMDSADCDKVIASVRSFFIR